MIYIPAVFLVVAAIVVWRLSTIVVRTCAKRGADANTMAALLWAIAPRVFEMVCGAGAIAGGWSVLYYFFGGAHPRAQDPYIPMITMFLFFVWSLYVIVAYLIVPLVFFMSAFTSDQRVQLRTLSRASNS